MHAGIDIGRTAGSFFVGARRLGSARVALVLVIGVSGTAFATSYTWTAGSGNWNVAAHWDPDTGFPNVTGDEASFFDAAHTITLTQPITVGTINMTPQNWTAGFTITDGGAGQTLTLDHAAADAAINVLGGRWAGGVIHAPVHLPGALHVTTVTSGHRALAFRQGITGVGPLKITGRISLEPTVPTTYSVPMQAEGTGYLWKRGASDAILAGVHSVPLAGDWATGTETIGGGGRLIVSGIVTNMNTQTRTSLFAGANNALVITNGGQLVNFSNSRTEYVGPTNTVVVTGEGSLYACATLQLNGSHGLLRVDDGGLVRLAPGDNLSMRGASNTIWVGGSGAESIIDLQAKRLLIGEGNGAYGNRLIVDQGGVVTNGTIRGGFNDHQWTVGNSIIVTNGGHVHAQGGAGDWDTYSGNVVSNSTVITGDGSVWNNMGARFTVGRMTSGGDYVGHDNLARIEAGGVLTNCSVSVGQTPAFQSGPIIHDNTLIVANGGRLFSSAEHSYVGHGDCWNEHTASTTSNTAWVVGGEQGDALWHLGGQNLHIGYQRSMAFTYGNRVRIGRGGRISQVNHLYVGSANSDGNFLSIEGGETETAALTLYAGNALAPVLDAQGLTAVEVSGTATLQDGSWVRPSALEDAPKMTCAILTAGTLIDQGVALAPDVDPKPWDLWIENHTLYLSYTPPGPPETMILLY